MNLHRLASTPDHLAVDLGKGERPLAGSGVTVDTVADARGLRVIIAAPQAEPLSVRLRWHLRVPEGIRCLGDAWERGYGDLEWRGLVPERAMPWYMLIHDGAALHGVGVATAANAFAFWQIDEAGITLVLDVRNGGMGVRLGARRLEAATVVVREGAPGEDEFAAARAFCRALCAAPRLPDHPVYGANDWYYAYGDNSDAGTRRDARVLAELTAGLTNRPYAVIDGGWYGATCCAGGPWRGNAKFPDMPALASDLTAMGVRPGLWVRPLLHQAGLPDAWTIQAPREKQKDEIVLDPSLPEVLAQTERMLRAVTGWGYRLIKHDFTTYDLVGQWGFAMRHRPTLDGWRPHDDARTTAEIVLDLYRAIRRGAGDALIIGCNTIGHLSAGLFELSRTGNDTSGLAWEATRRNGVNTLAMRMPQHGALHAVDADCVGLTSRVDWRLTRQWLDVLSRSGTPLFVSADPAALGDEQRSALTRAYAIASVARPVSRPLDWRNTSQPRRWRHADGDTTYDWQADGGAEALCRWS
ncbi:MAG TPA: hypothetical protein VEL07_11810 [Planctomycetota bacterium]|nr:hypothetical protein [Planctomycetota bacterium]